MPQLRRSRVARREPACAATTVRVDRTVKRVLVTGGAGFISSNLIRHLLAHTRHEVISLDALTYAGNLENLADVMSHERLSFVHGDIRDAALVARARRRRRRDRQRRRRVARREVDRRGRLRVRDDERRGDADPARRDPRDAGRALPARSRRARSTARPSATRWTRSTRSNPRSPYAATKAGGDRLAYSYFVTYDLPIVIVRPFNNYGPRQHPEKVVPRFITQALAGEPLTIHGDGTRAATGCTSTTRARRSRR